MRDIIADNIGSFICAASLAGVFWLCGLPLGRAVGAAVLGWVALGAIVWELTHKR